MIAPDGKASYRLACQGGAVGADYHRDQAGSGAVVAQLAVIVLAPSRQRAIRAKHGSEVISRAHRNNSLAREGSAGGRHCRRHITVSCAVVAQLAVVVLPPSRERSIRANSGAVSLSRGDAGHRFARQW